MSEAEAFRKFEQDGHDRLADTYAEFLARTTARAVDPLLDAARVSTGTRLLDVACGPGVVSAAAAKRGARATGCDLSMAMVAIARRLNPALDFREADAEALPFPDAAFDAVVCNFGIAHFPRPEIAVSEAARVCAPRGRVAVTWWDRPLRSRINGVFVDAVTAAGAAPPASLPAGPATFRFSDDDALEALLTGAGLADPRVATHTWTYRVGTLDEWWHGGLGSMVRVGSTITHQSPAVQQRIRDAFDRLASVYAVDGGYDVPNSVKVAVGVRA